VVTYWFDGMTRLLMASFARAYLAHTPLVYAYQMTYRVITLSKY